MTHSFQSIHCKYLISCAAGAIAFFGPAPALAYCVVGDRTLPMTLAIDAPCVMDELMFPMAMGMRHADHSRDVEISGQLSKRITEDFGVSIGANWMRMWMPTNSSVMAMPMNMSMDMGMGMPPMLMTMIMPMVMVMPSMGLGGWQNLKTTFKYQIYSVPSAELIISAGLAVEWGDTGNSSVGAQRFTTLTPTVWFGKGFGDLPKYMGWLRAFAVTGQFGYSAPTWTRAFTTSVCPAAGVVALCTSPSGMGMSGMVANATSTPAALMWDSGMLMVSEERYAGAFTYGVSLQYSLSYLKDKAGIDLGLPDFLNQLTPIVEARFRTPISNVVPGINVMPAYNIQPRVGFASAFTSPAGTTGSINPGVIWSNHDFQLGAEAMIPINRQSGVGVGWMVSFDIYFHNLFHDTLGRPLISLRREESNGDHSHGDHRHGDHAQQHGAHDQSLHSYGAHRHQPGTDTHKNHSHSQAKDRGQGAREPLGSVSMRGDVESEPLPLLIAN